MKEKCLNFRFLSFLYLFYIYYSLFPRICSPFLCDIDKAVAFCASSLGEMDQLSEVQVKKGPKQRVLVTDEQGHMAIDDWAELMIGYDYRKSDEPVDVFDENNSLLSYPLDKIFNADLIEQEER